MSIITMSNTKQVFLCKGCYDKHQFLGKRCLPIYGKTSGEGLLGELLKHVGNEYVPMLKNSLQADKKSKNLVRPMHHADVKFILKRCCQQIRRFQFDILNKSKAICIIADEWSDTYAHEYCSVSARYVMDNLDFGVSRLENVRAETVTAAIVNALSEFKEAVDLRKIIVAQTYDGAMNMQGHLSGVQQRIRENFAPFAIPLHCVHHQVQLSVKEMNNKGHNLIKRVTDNCFIIVKIIKYSPKRNAMLDKVKHTIDSCRRAVNEPKNVYASLNTKILNFCVTRWTVRADSLNNIMKNYIALQTLFATILIEKTEKKGVNSDKRAISIGLVHHMQKFDSFLG